ncbi:LacI family transcriptional regulator, partial [Enterocloster bolteae]|uniref:LacI family DNA-binding transcriptional regulator n=1 Tax=Enterocloster bolteae TaxID=208479 RepID=UPI00214A3DB9
MVTIKDVAKKCGYSVCTVSRALSGKGYLKEETKQKILETVAELGYRPNTLAVNLKTGRRQALALVLPSLTNIYYTKLEQYLEACAAEKGYIIYLNNTEYSLEKEKQILENLIGMDIAGVIITPVTSQHDHIMNLAKYDIPYVYLNRSFEDDMEHCLRLDNKKAAYEAVSYMIKLGP